MMNAEILHISSNRHNKELAGIFKKMADCYRFLGNEHRFRAIAYNTVSKVLYNMKEPIDLYSDNVKTLDKIKGVGESIAEKIIEYLHTGKIRTFEELKKKVPYKLLDLMDINGVGPATIRFFYEEFGITRKEELIEIVKGGKLKGLKGFGEKKIENLKRVLKIQKREERIPLKTAERIAVSVLKEIEKIPGVINATIAGSIRRKKETIGDIDIIIVAEHNNRKKIINEFLKLPFIIDVKASGLTKVSVLIKENQMQVDIRLVQDYEYGSALLYFTGNLQHNIKLRAMAKNKGWKLNEYGVFDERSGKRLAGETEEEIYALFGLHFILPEKRLGGNELSVLQE